MPVELFSYTGAKLAAEVKTQFGDVGNVQITDEYILRWINNGQRSIAATNDFIEKSVTTNLLAGQSVYDLAVIFAGERVKSYSSVIADGVKLKHIPYQRYLEEDFSYLAQDKTQIFTEYASNLILVPAPTESIPSALTINFVGIPADLADINDLLTIPDRFYNALQSYVFARALELDENFDAAGQQLQQHAAALAVEAGRETLNPTDFYPTSTYVEPY